MIDRDRPLPPLCGCGGDDGGDGGGEQTDYFRMTSHRPHLGAHHDFLFSRLYTGGPRKVGPTEIRRPDQFLLPLPPPLLPALSTSSRAAALWLKRARTLLSSSLFLSLPFTEVYNYLLQSERTPNLALYKITFI